MPNPSLRTFAYNPSSLKTRPPLLNPKPKPKRSRPGFFLSQAETAAAACTFRDFPRLLSFFWASLGGSEACEALGSRESLEAGSSKKCEESQVLAERGQSAKPLCRVSSVLAPLCGRRQGSSCGVFCAGLLEPVALSFSPFWRQLRQHRCCLCGGSQTPASPNFSLESGFSRGCPS